MHVGAILSRHHKRTRRAIRTRNGCRPPPPRRGGGGSYILLAFLSIDGIYRAMGEPGRNNKQPQFTDHCFTGDYPTALTDQLPKIELNCRSWREAELKPSRIPAGGSCRTQRTGRA